MSDVLQEMLDKSKSGTARDRTLVSGKRLMRWSKR